jgi:hypothetical protein
VCIYIQSRSSDARCSKIKRPRQSRSFSWDSAWISVNLPPGGRVRQEDRRLEYLNRNFRFTDNKRAKSPPRTWHVPSLPPAKNIPPGRSLGSSLRQGTTLFVSPAGADCHVQPPILKTHGEGLCAWVVRGKHRCYICACPYASSMLEASNENTAPSPGCKRLGQSLNVCSTKTCTSSKTFV